MSWGRRWPDCPSIRGPRASGGAALGRRGPQTPHGLGGVWLFPISTSGTMPWATGLVRFDHRQIAAQAERLRAHCRLRRSDLPSSDVLTLVADLAGFEALSAPTSSVRSVSSCLARAGGNGGNPSGATDPGVEPKAGSGSGAGSRRPNRRPGRPLGLRCPSGPARPPRPGIPACGARPAPTLQHYDPEAVDYWVTKDGRGERRTLTHDTSMPRSEDFSWGLIRLVDRLGVSNEYLTFGGHLDAAMIDDVVVAAFASQAPLLRRGGHSQGWDDGADAIGASSQADGRRRLQTRLRAGIRDRRAPHPLRGIRVGLDRRRPGHRARRRSTTPSAASCDTRRPPAASAPIEWDAACAFLDAAVVD